MRCDLFYFLDSSEPLNLNRQITIYINRNILPLSSCRPDTESFSNHFHLHVNLCPVVATNKWCQNVVCKNIVRTIHLTFLNSTKKTEKTSSGKHTKGNCNLMQWLPYLFYRKLFLFSYTFLTVLELVSLVFCPVIIANVYQQRVRCLNSHRCPSGTCIS